MDYLGFNMAADTSFITLENVSSGFTFDTELGEVGVVNITLLTVSDNYQQLFGVVSGHLLLLPAGLPCLCT